jgi:transcriptional regulator GlxA family with amidase domain
MPAPVRKKASASDEREVVLSEEATVLLVRNGVHKAAERQGVSERTILRRFRKDGVSAREYISSTRCHLALLLLVTPVPVVAIARRLGFSSGQTFARFLRRELGASAIDLRRRLVDRSCEEKTLLPSVSIGRPS